MEGVGGHCQRQSGSGSHRPASLCRLLPPLPRRVPESDTCTGRARLANPHIRQDEMICCTLGHLPVRPIGERLYTVPDPTSATCGVCVDLKSFRLGEPEDDVHDTTAGVKVWAQATRLLSPGNKTRASEIHLMLVACGFVEIFKSGHGQTTTQWSYAAQ